MILFCEKYFPKFIPWRKIFYKVVQPIRTYKLHQIIKKNILYAVLKGVYRNILNFNKIRKTKFIE